MSIKRDMASGVFYTALAKIAGIFVTLGITAVLARLFTPEQFGTISIASVFIAFFEMLGNAGMGPAVIQKKDLDQDDLNNIFSFTLWISLALSAILALSAQPISDFYDGGVELRNILWILILAMIFTTLNMVPNALLMKSKRFKFAAIRALSVQIITGAIAIGVALLGAGIYALTINPVLSSILIFFINYSQNPLKLKLRISKSSILKVLDFSLYQFGFQLINYFCRHLDRLLMGKFMMKSDIGYYDKAGRLTMMPLNSVTFILSTVMHPVFSQIQDNPKLIAHEYLKVVKLLAFIGFPLTAAMFFMSKDLVFFFFGSQWEASIPCLKVFCFSVGFLMLSSSSGSIFQSVNDTKRLMGCGLFTGCTGILAVCLGVFYFKSIVGLAASLSVSIALNFLQCFFSLFVKSIGYGWKEFWKTLLPPFILSLIISAVLWAVSAPISHISNHFVCLVIFTVISLVIAVIFIQATKAYDLKGLLKTAIANIHDRKNKS